ncbi:cation diffusion facilitator family transporter [Candidatus Hydrogenedentota bacterium]
MNHARTQEAHVERREVEILYRYLVFFACLFIVKVSFGFISGSRTLLVAGILALFGILISTIALLRFNNATTMGARKKDFSYGKLEFFIVLFISLIIVISAITAFYYSVHLILNHTLYPPDITAGWVAAGIAASIWGILHASEGEMPSSTRKEIEEVISLLRRDIAVSIMTVVAVVLSRTGLAAIDYVMAIAEAVFIIALSVNFLHKSLWGLLDASCDAAILVEVSDYLKRAQQGLDLDELRVTRVGGNHEIVAIVKLPQQAKMDEAKDIAAKIRATLKNKFHNPHEVHVGFKGLQK